MTELVTLITGASSGIGAELARVFGGNGHRLALVARQTDKLHALATELIAAGQPQPVIIPCDLGEPGAADAVAAALNEAGVDVEYLVNNAGYGLYGEFADLDDADQLGIVDVNIRALTALTLRFRDSVIRNKGGILNVASIAGFLPGPGMAVYYASQAFVLSFTEALHYELGRRGVRVTALCPGPVPSGFQRRSGLKPGLDSAILNVSAADVARVGYHGLMRGKRNVLPGLGIKMVPFALRLFPRGFILGAVGRLQVRRR